jgi:hypothetical protein
MEPQDKEVLMAVFAARVSLAKKTEDQAAEEARLEHRRTLNWINGNGQQEHSFTWYCDEFDLDVSAVRRAIREKK